MIRRVLKVLAATVAGLLATLIGVVFLLLALVAGTRTGLHLAWQIVSPHLPDSVHVERVSGRLSGQLDLYGVKLKTNAMDLRVSHIRLRWQPARLLEGVLQFDRLAVSGVEATSLPHPAAAPSPSKPLTLPSRIAFPLDVRIATVQLTKLHYRASPTAKPVALDRLAFAAGANSNAIYLKKLTLEAPLLDLRGDLTMAPAAPYKLDGQLDWHARPPGYAPVAGKTTLGGSLERLKLTQGLSDPYALRVDATVVKPLNERKFDVTLELNGTQPSAIKSGLPAGRITLHAHADGTPADVDYTVKADAKGFPYGTGPLQIQTKGNYNHRMVTIGSLLIALSDHPTRVEGAGKIRLNGAAPHVDARLQWTHANWPLQGKPTFTSAAGSIVVQGTPEQVKAQLRARVGENGVIEGTAHRDGQALGADLRWTALGWPLTPDSKPRVQSGKGQLNVNGRLDAYRIKLDAAVAVPGQTGGHVAVSGQGDKTSLALTRIDVQTLRGQMNGKAQVAWKPSLSGSADLTGKGLNPGVLLKDWPGKVNFHLQGSGGLSAGVPHAHLQILSADGTLRRQALSVKASGDYGGGALDLKQLKAALGGTRLAASGHAGRQHLDLDWSAHSDDLSPLLPNSALTGKLNAKGRLTGSVKKPVLRVTASGDDLAYADYRLKTLRLDALVDVAGGSRSHLDLTVNKAVLGGVEAHSLSLSGQGTPRDHRIVLKADTTHGKAEVAVRGDYAGGQWSFRLTRASLQYPELAPWTLTAPAKGRVASQRQQIDRTCWRSGTAQVCLQGAHTRKVTTGKFDLSNLSFAYFRPLMPESLRVAGQVSAQGDFSQRPGATPSAHFKLQTSAGRLNAETDGGGAAVSFGRSNVVFALDQAGMKLKGALDLNQRGQIGFNARIPGGKSPLKQRRLRGEAKIRIVDIGFIADLVPQVERLGGHLDGNIHLSGTLAEPRVMGQLELAQGRASLLAPGLNVTDIKLTLAGEQSGEVRLQASAKSGGGSMRIGGKFDLAASGGPSGQLRIKGDAFQVFNTGDARVWASPDLAVKMHDRTIRVSGQVTVPKAQITPKQLPQSAVTVSSDQVIVRPNQKSASAAVPGYRVIAQVKLILGKDVHVEAFGLKGNLAGDLLVTSRPGEPVKGSGEINILKGEYRAYGQGLVIERGRILFPGGPINQPGIDARAVRHPADNVTVGVQVRGNLINPEFSLFSQPSMSQSETLSWLVLGKPLNGTSSSEDSLITQAALALGLKGGDFVTKKLGSALGVDTIGIQSGSGEAGSESKPKQAAFVIGKYLTPDLYVSYGIGLFQPVSTVKLQYTLSSHWKLATEASSVGSGGDVVYTIERGK